MEASPGQVTLLGSPVSLHPSGNLSSGPSNPLKPIFWGPFARVSLSVGFELPVGKDGPKLWKPLAL